MCNVTICVFIVHTDIWATAPLSWICSKLPRNWQSNKNMWVFFFLGGGWWVWGQRQDQTPPQEGKGNGHSRLNAHWHMVIKQGLLPYLTHCNVSLTNEQRMKGTVQLEQKELWWSRACKMGLWLPREKLWCPDTKGYRITISPSRSSILRTVRVAQKLLKKLKESGG